MNIEILNAIATFLNRVELRGSEVEAYNKVMEALGQVAQELQQQQPPAEMPVVEEE